MKNFTRLGALMVLAGTTATASAAPTFVNSLSVAGNTPDLSGQPSGANTNRFGHFSDLFYDAHSDTYYAMSDRGPGGGVISYEPRVSTFKLDVDQNTGAISNFRLQSTVILKQADGVSTYNGLAPNLDTTRPGGADNRVLGRSMDPEGIAVDKQGNMYISDEYGPSVYKFSPSGVLLQTFTTPSNLLPRDASNNLNYNGTRDSVSPPPVVTGRQDNRGFEGITLNNDGTKLVAVLQDPLASEGPSAQGRRGQNVRIVEFSVATGLQTAQYVYQLEPIADINDRIPGTANDYAATSQGRNIGLSGITCVGEGKYLVLERDNRGLSVDETVTPLPVGSKRVYQIDLAGATDVKSVALSNSSNTLPGGVTPVSKTLFLDIAQTLASASVTIPEKIEGLTFGPKLANGSYLFLLGSDNDFSVTQSGANVQFDVYVNAAKQYRYTALDNPNQSYANLTDALAGTNGLGAVPGDYGLIPGFLFAYNSSIPSPGSAGLAMLGGLLAARRRR